MSIGLPVYNGERFLREAIESLLRQSFEDWELLIGDNASTDGTESISRELAAGDSRISYFRHRKNFGPIQNFNAVFRISRGEYFKWAAVDDVCAPDFLLRCVEALDGDPSAVLAHPRTVGMDESGSPTRVGLIPGPGHDRVDYDYSNTNGRYSASSRDPVKRFRRLMRDLWFTVQLYGLIRADALSKTRLHPFHYMGDHILLAELVLHGCFLEVPEKLFYRRIHSHQTSVARAARQRVRLASTHPDTKLVSWPDVLLAVPTRVKLHLDSIRRAPLNRQQRIGCYLAVADAILRWGGARAGQVGARILRQDSRKSLINR